MATQERGRALTVFAILFGLLAVSNFLKPLQIGGERTAFVFLGARSTGVMNMVLGPLFGVFLAVYAYGVWNLKRFAMPMGHAYATYVLLNLALWTLRSEAQEGNSVVFLTVYATVAIGVSLGSALMLTKRKSDLS